MDLPLQRIHVCPPRSLVAFRYLLIPAVTWHDSVRYILSVNTIDPLDIEPRQNGRQSHSIASVRPLKKINNEYLLELLMMLARCVNGSEVGVVRQLLTPRVAFRTSEKAVPRTLMY